MTFESILAIIHAEGFTLYNLHEERVDTPRDFQWFATIRRPIDRRYGIIGNGYGNTPAEAVDLALHFALTDMKIHDHAACYGGQSDTAKPDLTTLLDKLTINRAPTPPVIRRKLSL